MTSRGYDLFYGRNLPLHPCFPATINIAVVNIGIDNGYPRIFRPHGKWGAVDIAGKRHSLTYRFLQDPAAVCPACKTTPKGQSGFPSAK